MESKAPPTTPPPPPPPPNTTTTTKRRSNTVKTHLFVEEVTLIENRLYMQLHFWLKLMVRNKVTQSLFLIYSGNKLYNSGRSGLDLLFRLIQISYHRMYLIRVHNVCHSSCKFQTQQPELTLCMLGNFACFFVICGLFLK